MKKVFIVCLGLLLAGGLAFADNADRASLSTLKPDKEAMERDQVSQPSTLPPIYQEGKALLNEGFEDATFPPAGWQVLNRDGGAYTWDRYTYNPYSGVACAAVRWESSTLANDDWLITPPLYPTANDTLKWWMRAQSTSYNDSVQIWISTTDSLPTSFSYVTSFSNQTTTYIQRSVPLGSYDGQRIFVAFVYRALDQWRLYIDNVTGPELTQPSYDHDLSLKSIDIPAGAYMNPDEVFTPTVTVKNRGLNPETNFLVVYRISDWSKAVVYQDTVEVLEADTIFPGQEIQYTFSDFVPQGLTNYDVAAWVWLDSDMNGANDTKTRYFRTFNELQGNVTDDNNGGAPVDGATITATGPATYTTTTNSNGDYFFFDMTGGTYTVTASKTGYITETVPGVTVADNAQTTLDLSMGYPVLTLTPTDSIYLTLPPDGYDNTTWQFQLANDGSRDMTYSVIWPEVTKGGKVLGDSLFGFTVNHVASLGIEVAAGYIWVTSGGVTGSGDGNYFLRYDFNGNFVDSLSQGTTSTWGYRDMAFDGTYLYAADENSGGLRQINTTTGAWTGTTIPVPGGLTLARGVAYNPDLDRFYAANWASNIVEFDRSGTQTNSWANTKSIYGLAYDGTNPAGPSLWVWSQDGTPQCQASRFDLTTGTYGSETWQGTAIDPTAGLAGGATVTDQVVPGYRVMLGFIQDNPDRAVAYELRALNCDWLNISPNTGTVPAYNNVVLDVAFNAAGLTVGDYAADVTFNTNAYAGKRTDHVPAYLHVATGVAGGQEKPLSYAFGLNANRPNPVSGKTTFSFTLPKAQDYSLKVYNIAGQQVASFTGRGQAGPNSISWNTGKNGAGVYFYQLASGGMSATRKLVVVK